MEKLQFTKFKSHQDMEDGLYLFRTELPIENEDEESDDDYIYIEEFIVLLYRRHYPMTQAGYCSQFENELIEYIKIKDYEEVQN